MFHRICGMWVLCGVVGVLTTTRAYAAEPNATSGKSVREILAKFEKGDPGWTVRMTALVQTVKIGSDAVPVLVESLDTGSASIREFAAHALGILGDARSQSALARALDDPDRGVRVYAVRALSSLGTLKLTDEYRVRMGEKSDHWQRAPWMDDYLLAAQQRELATQAADQQRVLKGYDLSKMDTARVGHAAPDFMLPDRQGKMCRLRDYRGKKIVVLDFDAGIG